MRRIPMHMRDWLAKLDAFLHINDREILTHAGKISHEVARQLAEDEYEKFSRSRLTAADRLGNDFDRLVQHLPATDKKPRSNRKKGGNHEADFTRSPHHTDNNLKSKE